MVWLSKTEVSELIGVSERTIQRNFSQYEYQYIDGVGRGGRVLQIALESLSKEAQDRYHGQQPEKELKNWGDFTRTQRELADRKAYVLQDYRYSHLPVDEFLEKHNAENPEFPVSRDQLFNWQRKLKENGDVLDLVDNRGGHNKGQSSIPEEVWQVFYALYMDENQRSMQLCYDLTERHFNELLIPHISAFKRRLNTVPEYAKIYYRKGKKAFNDSLPCMSRDYTSIDSNDIWFSDHHLCDVFVLDRKGRPVRPWVTAWTDARSRRVVGVLTRTQEPNTDAVKLSLRYAMEANGIPFEVYIDNGKDYKAKENFSKDYPLSLTNKIGINSIFATPYNAKAKPIERFFGTFESRFGKRFITYAGSDAKKRPERLKDIPLDQYPTIDKFAAAVEAYMIEFNNTKHSGQGMNNQPPEQVYFENLKVKRQIADPEILRLLCGRVEERTISKSGISIFNNTYWHDALAEHMNERVTVTYDPENLNELFVFDADGKAICKAEPRLRTLYRKTTKEDYIEVQRQRKQVRKLVKELKPERQMPIWTEIAQNQLVEKVYSETGQSATVDMVNSTMTENKKLLSGDSNSDYMDEEKWELQRKMLRYMNDQRMQGG